MSDIQEGHVKFGKYKTYYKIYGDPKKSIPLVVLHGGPGYPHYYLENLSALAPKGIPVIFYDQLGCGQSDRPNDSKLWTIELFVNELVNLRKALGLKKVYLLGHSWGTMLAVDYMLSKPQGVMKLILASPVVDSRLWSREAEKLKMTMGADVAKMMTRHEKAGTTSDPEYRAAYSKYIDNFICRLKPYPDVMKKADSQNGIQVYRTMWGRSEPTVTGTLKNWTMLGRLKGITVPVLLTSGRYDEATPHQTEQAYKELPGSRWVLFEKSSHMSHMEEPRKYLKTLTDFLS